MRKLKVNLVCVYLIDNVVYFTTDRYYVPYRINHKKYIIVTTYTTNVLCERTKKSMILILIRLIFVLSSKLKNSSSV